MFQGRFDLKSGLIRFGMTQWDYDLIWSGRAQFERTWCNDFLVDILHPYIYIHLNDLLSSVNLSPPKKRWFKTCLVKGICQHGTHASCFLCVRLFVCLLQSICFAFQEAQQGAGTGNAESERQTERQHSPARLCEYYARKQHTGAHALACLLKQDLHVPILRMLETPPHHREKNEHVCA